MKNTSQQYLNSEAHGYLMEAKACKLFHTSYTSLLKR